MGDMALFNTPSGMGSPLNGRVLIGSLKSANMSITTDQAFNLLINPNNKLIVRGIIGVYSAGTIGIAAGGVYDAASKGGNAIVAAAQTYVSIANNVSLDLTIVAAILAKPLSISNLFLSLTTGSADGSARADFYAFGDVFI